MKARSWLGCRLGILASIIGVVVACAAPTFADAATYYVSPGGSDSNSGTKIGEPWATVGKANESVKAGDTVYLRDGTYGASETTTALSKAGTEAAPISWLAYPGDLPPVFHGRLRLTGAYNRVSGVLVEGPTGSIEGHEEVPVWLNAHGVRLDHSEVTGSRWHAGVYVSAADGFSVDHDYVHDNGDPKRKESEYEDQGIYVNETTTGTVYDNLVTANVSYGVQLYRKADQVTVNHNTIVGNAYGGVVVSTECKGNLIANNIVVDNGGYGIRGTSIASEAGNEVVDNLVWGQEPHNTEGSIGITFSGTLETAPLFVGESDFHLQAGSPAIEAAGSPTVADDIENNARGNPSDLGAYEYVPPPAVEPAFVGATSASADASTTLTIAKPSGTAAGEVMVAQVVSRGGAAIVPPKGWSEIRDTAKSSSDHMTTFVKVTGSEEPASYAFTSTDAVGKAGGIATWEHVDTSSPIVESSGATGTGTTVTAGSVTTTAAHTPIIFVAGALGAATTTPPTGLTERWDIASNGKYKASAESASVVQPESGPSGSKSATLSTSGGGWEAQLIALRPE